VGARDEGLSLTGDVRAQGAGAVLVELGVEIVEESHRGVPGLLPVHLQARQNESEKEAASLTGRRLQSGVATVEEHHHGVAVGSGQAASRGSLAPREITELVGEGLSGLGLGGGELGTDRHLILLTLGPESVAQRGRQARGIEGPALPETRTQLHKALGPDVQVRALLLKGGVALTENSLECARVGSVGRPQRACGAIEELPAITHGAPDNTETVGRVDDNLETPLILPGNDVTTIHAKLSAAGHQLNFKSIEARVPAHLSPGTKTSGPTADERR